MGVKNLWDILESCKQTLPLHHLQNKRLCVDLSCWMIQFQNASKSLACIREKLYLRNLFHRLRALISLNCTLILVTDGAIPGLKRSAYQRRLGLNNELSQDDSTSLVLPSLRRNRASEFSRMIKEAKDLGMALGIPCLDGLEEAEAECALLNSSNICDGCFSADSDIFLFGARTVYRDIFLGDSGYVICYEMVDIEKKLGFGRNSLVALALLLGGDYSQGLRGFGPETSSQIVKSLGDDHVLQRVMTDGFQFAKQIKEARHKKHFNCNANDEFGNKKNTAENNQFLKVIDAYLNPKCHSPDSDAVQRVCVQHPFLRNQVQKICSNHFGWDAMKTDQYILPKIAERNLRRFANLRATTLYAGILVPVEELPVPCPVYSILKQRKVHKCESFEVSWKGIDGLETSIVPADLMRSACPEMVTEYLRAKDEKKKDKDKDKRKPRARKLDRDVPLSEVERQLQGLLLSVNSESGCSDQVNGANHPAHTRDARSSEIIDLLSPSPPIRACKARQPVDAMVVHLSKHELGMFEKVEGTRQEGGTSDADDLAVATAHCLQHANQKIEIIDVLDSDNDFSSPEHLRTARDLRLFVNDLCLISP